MTSRRKEGALSEVLRVLGTRLRHLRLATGSTQEAAAQVLGVSTQAIRNWENGRHEPTYQHVEQLTRLYGTSLTELLSFPPGVSTLSQLPTEPLRITGYLLAGPEEHEASEPLGTTHLPSFLVREHPAAFALIVAGQSLEIDGLRDGDLVLVDPENSVSEDGIYVVQVGQSPFPRYVVISEGRAQSGAAEEFIEQEVQVIGKIVWHLRRM